MKVYVASSWKNILHPSIVRVLKRMGHEVYDFRNPAPGNHGFRWTDVDNEYRGGPISVENWRRLLSSDIAKDGYDLDIGAVRSCDVCVLVLPAGRSACFEMGYAMGMGKRGIVLAIQDEVPDLMFRDATICGSVHEFYDAFGFKMDESPSRGPKVKIAWYLGDTLCCTRCGVYSENAGQLARCPFCHFSNS